MDDIGGRWVTIGGRRVFIKDGQDLETAMKNSGKFKIKNKDIDKTINKKYFYAGDNNQKQIKICSQ